MPSVENSSSENASNASRKILLIDDERMFTRLFKVMLEENKQWEVVELHDSRQAEQRARELQPDLILVDLIMAPRDGSEVLSSFENDPELARIPLVVMSAFLNDRIFPDKPIDFGNRRVLEKPMQLEDFDRLIEHIEEEMERRWDQS